MASLTLVSVTASNAAVDLTALGANDWAVWDNTAPGPTPADHKSGGGSTISLAIYGAGAYQGFSPDPRTISWTDGTNTASRSETECSFNSTSGTGNGYEVSFPADTNTREARLFGGIYSGNLKVTATISDASSSDQIDSTTLTSANFTLQEGVVVVQYAAASSGQTLKIRIESLAGGSGPLPLLQAASWKLLSAPGAALASSVSCAAAVTASLPIALSSGPTASNIASTGFDVGATADTNGTAALIVTTVGAGQPSNATFDASSESTSITAGTPFTIHHTGQ